MNIIRYPFPAALDEHKAEFETDEGEWIAGLAHLASHTEPTPEPLVQIKNARLRWSIIGLILGVIAVVILVALTLS